MMEREDLSLKQEALLLKEDLILEVSQSVGLAQATQGRSTE